jgi:sec-independent protein translocase protein TatC
VPYVFCSIVLAYGGVVFAYFISLPNALHFLAGFGGKEITALITADEYYSFVLSYLLGFALLFQIPIIVLFINRIKPMKPGSMMGAQRYIILASFVVAAILTPTPDPINQTIMAMPAVVLYQVGIFLVWRTNKNHKSMIDMVVLEDIPEDIVLESSAPERVLNIPRLPALVAQAKPVASTMQNQIGNRMTEVFARPMPTRPRVVRQSSARQMGQFMDVINQRVTV